MNYHAVLSPHPRSLPSELARGIRSDINSLNSEMQLTLKKLVKREAGFHFPHLIHLFDEEESSRALQSLQDNDTLTVHGEGFPFLIGPTLEFCSYVLTAGQFAELLHQRGLPDKVIHIKLMCCNSGTNFEGQTYAEDLSQVLLYLFRYKSIITYGYNGFIVVKNNGKYSASATTGDSARGNHASVDDTCSKYIEGILVESPRRILIDEMHDSSWALPYITLTRQYRTQTRDILVVDR
jgi:hypothetical protein